MECPICGNTMGFAIGMCVECGYNHINHSFDTIKVDTKTLRAYLPDDIYFALLTEHKNRVSKVQ